MKVRYMYSATKKHTNIDMIWINEILDIVDEQMTQELEWADLTS